MSAQVGIPKYNDLVNRDHLDKLKNTINLLCLLYNKLSSKESVENRENDNFEVYSKQYNKDMIVLSDLNDYSNELVKEVNETIFEISKRCIDNHIHPSLY